MLNKTHPFLKSHQFTKENSIKILDKIIIGLIFLCKKLYLDMWKIIKNIKLPVWNLVFMGIASFAGAIAEKATNNNFIFEEGFELFFYTTLAGVVYLYSRHQNFAIEQNEL